MSKVLLVYIPSLEKSRQSVCLHGVLSIVRITGGSTGQYRACEHFRSVHSTPNTARHFFRLPQFVLPNPKNLPPGASKLPTHMKVARSIALEFFRPKNAIVNWDTAVTWASMPKTAINK